MPGKENQQPAPINDASTKPKDSPPHAKSISPTNFYSSSNKPPPLPSRPIKTDAASGVGSAHTRYAAPASSPPTYRAEGTPFREPELVEDNQSDSDTIPALISNEVSNDHNAWGSETTHWDNWTESSANGWGRADVGGWANSVLAKKVQISGTDAEEEDNWWNPAVRAKHPRPGPGCLPPALEDLLHHPEHTLFSVIAKQPDTFRGAEPSSVASASTSSASQSPPIEAHHSPPTTEDLVRAVPHPNAYYCRRHNGWVILQWNEGRSNILPPLAKSFEESEDPTHPLPQQSTRGWSSPCTSDQHNSETGNKTHHFHYYEHAVDAHQITPPFHRPDWQKADTMKQKRRRMTTSTLDMDSLNMAAAMSDDRMDEDVEEEGDLLHLWVCCQCPASGVVSSSIPGVIPVKFVDEFTKLKQSNPVPGKSGEECVVQAWETILTILENKLWKGNDRSLTINGKAFTNKVGWNTTVQRIFESLDFTYQAATEETLSPVLLPPQTSTNTAPAIQKRAKLLRAYVEISVWLSDFERRFAKAIKTHVPRALHVDVAGARDMYQMGIGAHLDQIPRGMLPSKITHHEPLRLAWKGLGLTATSYSPDLLMFAYLAQCRCDPVHTSLYFTWLLSIVEHMQAEGLEIPQDIQMLAIDERGRGRFSHHEFQQAAKTLGFGEEGTIAIEISDDVSDEFIISAWRHKIKGAWSDVKDGAWLQKDANDALKILAQQRGSVVLMKAWEEGQLKSMNPERAYSTLEIPSEVDDDMVLTVFSMRVEEQPSQGDKMREALEVIAEIRDSARLRKFLDTGMDPGDIVAPVRADLPRGLNQLGNTCYLNSLLQYFYTIKELRDAIRPMTNAVREKDVEDEKVSDDALKQHRVGGRLVTRREIGRSKKFVSQLAELFYELEYSQSMAITPALELAKLALVTSRDEEEDEVDRGGTASSNDTDATLVDDSSAKMPQSDQALRSPLRSPGSVLGKRLRDEALQKSDMDVDSPQLDKDGFVMVPNSIPPHQYPMTSSAEGASSRPDDIHKEVEIIDVDMKDGTPAQKPAQRKVEANSDNTMMFGKQHDVAECMDNCMFQIETALLKFDPLSSAVDKGSIVKRLFYGTIRQRIAAVSTDSKSKAPVNEKVDLFSNLPVNVAEDGFDIYDGLSGYFEDIVDFEGGKARMEVSVVDLPPLLQIQLQRVQFNRETLQSYKSQAYVKFDETIYMDRFLEGADPPKKARSKIIQTRLNECRERLEVLTSGKYAPFADALASTLDFLSKQEGVSDDILDDDLIGQLNGEQGLVKAEIDDLRKAITGHKEDLEAIWRAETKVPYELTSVFVHRGSSPQFGHYFFYSRNLPEQPDVWFKYNDSSVTEVPKEEVFADTTGSTANPYLLVFARKGLEVIQTVNRFNVEDIMADA